MGRIDSFVAPYEFDVTDAVRFGAENVFAVQVDSGSTEKIARENLNLGDPNSTNGYIGMIQYWAKWGGIIGHVELIARPSPSLEDVVIRADTAKNVANVSFDLKRTEAGESWEGSAKAEIVPVTGTEPAWSAETPVRFAPEATQSEAVQVSVDMPAMHLWSPEDPFLYQVRVTLLKESKEVDRVVERTGMREFAVTNNGGAFLINGRPHFLRGVGYDSIEPITGTPMPDKKIYIERLQHLKDLGFNCVRMLAHTPVKEFFDAADEVGMLVQSDGEWFLGFAAIMSLETSRLLTDQVPRLIREHRNRPSWYAFSCMNEGAFINAEDAAPKRTYIDGAYRAFQELDPTRFFLASDGGADLWPTDIISSLGDMKKATEAGASTPPAQVLLGDLDHFSYFSRGLSDEEMQGLAGVAPGVPEAEAAIRRLNPAGYWAGKDVAGGKDLADEAPKLLAAGSQPFSAGIWVKPKGFRPGDFGTFFSFGAAEESKAILVCLDGYTAQGQVVVGRFNRNVLASETSLVVNE